MSKKATKANDTAIFVCLSTTTPPPASLTAILAWAASLFLWAGDLSSAEKYINSSIDIAESYSLGPLAAVGRARKAQLAIRRGEAESGVASLQASLAEIHAVRYELITTEFNISLVQGLASVGRAADAMARLDDAIRQVNASGDTCFMPELLRVKAGLLRSIAHQHDDDPEICLTKSLELSRGQGALGWELRAAIDIAALLARKGLRERGKAILDTVLEQFTQGFDTVDLQAAQRLSDQLS